MGYILPVDNINARNEVHRLIKSEKIVPKVQKAEKIKLENKQANMNTGQNSRKSNVYYTRQLIHSHESTFLTGKGFLFNEQV